MLFKKETPYHDCSSNPCRCSKKNIKDKHNWAVQKGPEFDQKLDQHSFQEGYEQDKEQEQNTKQVPIQEGPELDSSHDQSGNILGPEQSNEKRTVYRTNSYSGRFRNRQ